MDSEIALVYCNEINASDIIDPNLVVPGPLPSDLAPDLGESKFDDSISRCTEWLSPVAST